MKHPFARLGAFARRHKHAEEAAAEAVAVNLVWTFAKRFLFGAAVAGAATFATVQFSGGPTYHPTEPLSTKGAAFVTRYEGVRYRPYNDPFNCTVGVGHLIHMGACSTADYARWTITPAQATTLLLHDAGSATACVHRNVTRRISVPQDDALIDLTFNIGCGGLESSGALRDVNAGNLSDLTRALTAWSYASGRYLAGLYARRLAEAHLYLAGDYGAGIGKYVPEPVRPIVTPKPVPAWAWRWAEWRLGRGPYKGRADDSKLRPKTAPVHIPAWAFPWLKRTFH